MKSIMLYMFVIMIFVAIIISISYGAFRFKRWINWKSSYESQTQALIDKKMSEHIKKYHNGEIK